MKQNLSAQFALAVAIAMGAAVTAHAQPFAGTTTGTFVNPVAGPENTPGAVYSGTGTSTFTWGTPDGTAANQLTFTGGPFSAVPANTLFGLGSLSYFNGTVSSGTDVDQITLDAHIDFTAPSGVSEDFDFPLNITTTDNTGNQHNDADYITLPGHTSTTFIVDGVTYTLGLELGQFTGGGYLDGNTFHVYEGDTATAPLEGIITTDLNFSAPDSTSTMMLLGGIGSVLCYARRKLS